MVAEAGMPSVWSIFDDDNEPAAEAADRRMRARVAPSAAEELDMDDLIAEEEEIVEDRAREGEQQAQPPSQPSVVAAALGGAALGGAALGASIGGALGGAFGGALGGAFGAAIGGAIGSSLGPAGTSSGSSSASQDTPPLLTQAETLDAGQQRAFDLALSGMNLFLTGGPGTGKSFTLRKIIGALKQRHSDAGVLVAAPTGVAALIAEGQTLHSKPGPGVPKGTTEAFGNMRSKSSADFWGRVRALVVDEVSMVDAEFLDWYMVNVPSGVQLIFCGDFSQLPPVPDKQGSMDHVEHLENCIRAARRKDNNETREQAGRADPALDDPGLTNGGWLDMSKNTPFGLREVTGKFAFQSICWREARLVVHHLTTVHRTKEPILLDALTDLRAGLANSARVAELVRRTHRPLPRRDGVEPTILYPKKGSVQRENVVKLEQCDAGSAVRYSAFDHVELSLDAPPWVTKDELLQDAFFRDDCQATKELELRLGAQVMLLRNEMNAADDPTIRTPGVGRLVNGSRGVIIGFDYA